MSETNAESRLGLATTRATQRIATVHAQARGRLLDLIHRLGRVINAVRPRDQEDRNIFWLHGDIAMQGIVAGGAAAYLSVFAVRLGASTLMVGLLTSLPALITAIMSIPAGRFVGRQARLVPVVVWSRASFRMAYLFIALVPWLLPGAAPAAIVVIWSLAAVGSAFAMVSFTAAMGEAVPPRRRASIISLRYAIHAVVTAITLPITGRILDSLPFPLGYQVVFFISFVAAMLSVWSYSRIRLPDQRVRPPAVSIEPVRARFRSAIASVRSQGGFLAYLGSSALFRLGINLPAALFSIYWVKHLGLSDSAIATVTMINSVCAVVGYFYWGNMAKRRGHGPVLVISALGLSLYPLITALSRSLAPLLLASVVGGWFSAGINLALFNVLLAVAPREGRSSYVAMDSVVSNSVAFLGPILGSYLTGLVGIQIALAGAAVVRLAGGLLFLVKRVRD